MSDKGTIHERLNDATGGDTSSATAGRRAELSRLRQRVVLIAASGGCAKIRWRHGDGSTCSERVKLTGMKGRNKIGCEGREPIDLLAVEAFDG